MGKVRRVEQPAPAVLRPFVNPFGRRDVIGLFLVVASAISVLSLISPSGILGSVWSAQIRLLFGDGAYVAPPWFMGIGLALLRSRLTTSYSLKASVALGWLLLFALFEAVLQARAGDLESPFDGAAGGIVGWLVRQALVAAAGSTGAIVLTVVGMLVAVVLILEITPPALFRFAVAGVGHARTLVAERLIPRLKIPRREVTPVRDRETLIWPDMPRRPSVEPVVKAPARVSPRGGSRPATPVQAESPADGRPPEGWELPPVTLLQHGVEGELSQSDITRKVKQIEQTLADFDVPARVVEVNPGPTVTQFGVEPGFREKRDRTGAVVRREKVKVSEITSLANDLALALAAPAVRIEAPVPGRHVVGIEVPNGTTTVVGLRQLIESTAFQRLLTKARLPIALGEDVSGHPVVADLAKMPHLLIAGATGSGKSGCVNAIITCLLLHTTPDELRLLLIDPKRVELSVYNDVPHLLRPVVVDVDKVVGVLKWAVHEMDERYKRFEVAGVRNIEGYNKRVASEAGGEPLPYIVIIIDELADLMMLAPDDVERLICRLAQLARATGIHLVVATQRPSVDVITGLIKANFPSRISFAVTSQVDSRTILDTVGAEKLLGRGDMLYLPSDAAKPLRVQGTWVNEDEIDAVVSVWQQQGRPRYVDELVNVPSFSPNESEGDELYDKAVELAEQHERISASLLQRRLRIGYTRAARLVEMLEQNGVVRPSEGGRSRELVRREDASSTAELASDVEEA